MNGELHSLCEEHRIKQNAHQRKSDRKMKYLRLLSRREIECKYLYPLSRSTSFSIDEDFNDPQPMHLPQYPLISAVHPREKLDANQYRRTSCHSNCQEIKLGRLPPLTYFLHQEHNGIKPLTSYEERFPVIFETPIHKTTYTNDRYH